MRCNCHNSLTDITDIFNEQREKQVTRRTIKHYLHKHGLETELQEGSDDRINRLQHVLWCKEKRRWPGHRRLLMSLVVVDNHVYTWRKWVKRLPIQPCVTYSEENLKVMIWDYICWHGVGTVKYRCTHEQRNS